MKFFWWTMFVLAVAGIGFGEWRFLVSVRGDMSRRGSTEAKGAPYDIVLSGPKLMSVVRSELATVNAARFGRMDTGLGDAVLVETVRYERNNGVVRSDGQVRELSEGRQVLAVMDAFDDSSTYLTSVAAPIQTVKGQLVPFALSMPDRVDLATLSFRVLRASDKSQITSLTEDEVERRKALMQGRAVLLPDDTVIPADLPEVVERLRHLGYISETAIASEPVLVVVFNRFRRDHGMPRTNIVDIETFLAIRAVSTDFRPSFVADL